MNLGMLSSLSQFYLVNSKRVVNNIASQMGIRMNGDSPTDPHIHDESFYHQVLSEGTVGLGESFMEGKWSCQNLEGFLEILAKRKVDRMDLSFRNILVFIAYRLKNLQTKLKSKKVIEVHYEDNNEMYEKMLGPSTAYTCGYWKEDTKTLDQAQYNKFDLVCRKAKLKKGDIVLDMGCGWGGLANYMNQKYGCKVVGVCLSKDQIKICKEKYGSDEVQFFCCDYRDKHIYNSTNIEFDKVVTVGLGEHVGRKNYKSWFKLVKSQLKDGGFFVLHVEATFHKYTGIDLWINKYIFPYGEIPSLDLMRNAYNNVLYPEDLHVFERFHYYKTLNCWLDNFNEYWGDREKNIFYKMWIYYLVVSTVMHKTSRISLIQLVLSKNKFDEYIQER